MDRFPSTADMCTPALLGQGRTCSPSSRASLKRSSGMIAHPWGIRLYRTRYPECSGQRVFQANKPASLASLMKVQRKEKREDSVRIRALNSILYKALTDLLQTSAISQEVCDLNVELSKVSVSADFLVCRAYWMTSGNLDTDNQIELVLQKYAPQFRHLMLTHQVLGSVPQVVFVRDKEDAMVQEVERLLAIADFGENHDRELNSTSSGSTTVSQVTPASMFGIDHADLNKQILDYKRKMKDRIKESDHSTLSLKQQEQLAEIRKQKMLKKKKHKGTVHDEVDSLENYLLSKYNDTYPDEEAVVAEENELDFELEEEIKELEEEGKSENKDNTPVTSKNS
ncbi:hypothetical protein XENTR_v10016732 [Xenopus tropicalis]|uniref:Ribosome-binding factor A, mitochondrial isoform X2 n=1 Tax=Xenopus tropicalis TaxID=8364 RepID=A0A8J1JSZ7_XENTR|nr:putative ribosome-binding factor A, mitochondrial isoform X2 [Xenopus tropicalis]KAE8598124.1 hypothetical protein XENTR_v10016732 [Xenopus tropicalis]